MSAVSMCKLCIVVCGVATRKRREIYVLTAVFL